MHKHSYEENGVEVRNGGGEANNSTPSKGHRPVRDVILKVKRSLVTKNVKRGQWQRTGLRE